MAGRTTIQAEIDHPDHATRPQCISRLIGIKEQQPKEGRGSHQQSEYPRAVTDDHRKRGAAKRMATSASSSAGRETAVAAAERHEQHKALREDFLALCTAHSEGLRNEQLREHFGARYLQLVPIINTCLQENRIRCMKTETNELVYQAVDPGLAEKMRNLGAEQLLVYQVVEKAGNKGIWHKDIRSQTSLQQPALKKILKNLESRQLIKSTSSISSKTRKLYLLYDLEPAKEITGGPWYTEHEFDHEFIEELGKAIYHFIKTQRKPPSLMQIADYVRTSGVSKVELAPEEVQLIVNSLAYDMKIEEVRGGILGSLGSADGGPCYKVSRHVEPPNHFTAFPCGLCPVQFQCEEGGEISPASCRYFTEWLGMRDASAMEF